MPLSSHLRAWLAGGAVLLLAGVPAWASPEAPPAAKNVELRLFLIGDAGAPAPGGEPVLLALSQEIARDPARSVVVFLGDNVYPRGLPAPTAGDRREMERRLDAQIDVVGHGGARGIFLPGNHDWDKGKADGWEGVKRQGAHVEARGAPLVGFLPRDGCPGPEWVDLGRHLRLVILDTQWWLQEGPKPVDPSSDCAADSESEVKTALERALGGAGERHVVVAGHHPLATGGPHGGHFSFREHVFPLTDVNKALWIPLPVVGSIYPLARRGGVAVQDLTSDRYRHLKEALESVFHEHRPLVYASGHEHTLQVLEGRSARNLLVSGAGTLGHTSSVRAIEGSRFASSAAGFMRLDFEENGAVRLAVLGVTAPKDITELHAEWISPLGP